MNTYLHDLPSIDTLLLHRGCMLLLNRMIAASDEDADCEAIPDASAWYANTDGSMPAWIGIELMAQTIAVHVATLAQRTGNPPRPGVLLGTRAFRAIVDRFPVGKPLRIRAHLTYRDSAGLGAYDCTLADALGTPLATAAITVYEPDNFETFIHGETRS